MKSSLVLAVFAVAVFGAVECRHVVPNPRLTLNLNTIIDGVLKQIQANASQMGLDPFKLPDLNETFGEGFFSGGLTLTHGELINIESIHRKSDIIVNLTGTVGGVNAEVTFDLLDLGYDFALKLLEIGPSGHVTGEVVNLDATLDATLDMSDTTAIKVQVNSLTLTDTDIKVEFEGLGNIIDGIIDTLVDTVADIFRKQLNELLSTEVAKLANDLLKDTTFNLNDLLGGL